MRITFHRRKRCLNELVVFKELIEVSESLNTYVVKALKKELGLSS